jgi:excinuclease ABC subunit C
MAKTRKRQPAPPRKPGVYILRDRNDRVIYVGKARDLRNRLRTYTGGSDAVDPKVQILRSRMTDFEYIVAESETEALILESNLIKEHRPRYNVKLRDDKRYPFIKVTTADRFPRAYITRLVRQDGSRYFGPYTDAKAVRRTLRLVGKLFPLRQCTTFRLRPRPCLNHQIGRCMGPCTGDVTEEEYGKVIRALCLFLEGRADEVLALLDEQMRAASEDRRYEEAAALRDRMADIAKMSQRQRVLTTRQVDRDAVAVARHQTYAVASVVRVRGGKLLACENLPLELGPRTEDGETRSTFLKQFYNISEDVPAEILTDADPTDRAAIEAWLSEKSGRRVAVSTPARGERRFLIDFASENARLALKKVFETREAPSSVVELGEALGMSRPPRLISGVDVSNVSGALAVGTVVTFRDGRPDRGLYRKYRIKTVKGADDYGMIREVVTRHIKRVIREEGEAPDLLVIDGGKGQLSAAAEGLTRAGARGIGLVALAKREEELFVRGRSTPLPLPFESRSKKLLVRVRNEVHRFSVTYHRSLRLKQARRSVLDEIDGVGPARKEALLKRFGSVDAMASRPVEEIAEVRGIGLRTAEAIKKALEEGRRGDRPAGRD